MNTDEKTPRKRRRFVRRAFFVFPFFILPGLVWIGSLSDRPQVPPNGVGQAPETAAPKGAVVTFESFLIPIEAPSRHTLISLSFALQVPNGRIVQEIDERMCQIRGFIYDTLRESFEGSEGIPSLQLAKNGITRAVALVLPNLQVGDVFISRFLAL